MAAKKKSFKRQITVCRKSFRREGRYVPFPIITLSGKWLKDSGFRIGQVIDVHYECSKLIITLADEQRLLSEE